MIPHLISHEPFTPHTLEHLTEVRAFPNPLPAQAYDKMLAQYEALDDTHIWRIIYESDGLTITGMLAEPKDWSPQAHPLIIYNRGGSREYGKLTLLSVIRDLLPYAKQGYLVAASNYRGADGGEGFDEFGGDDVNDILSLLELAKQHPGWDGRNLYMIGHSRGAMMSYLAMRRGAAPNAAICLAGMADLFQTAKDRPDIENGVWHRLLERTGQDKNAAYRERSVTQWIDEITVPVQLHHGDADKSVHFSQSQRIADGLREHGRTHEIFIYPSDNHALLRNWDHVVEKSTEWMQRFAT